MTGYLIAAVVFLGGIIAAFVRGQSIGKTQAKSEQQAGELKAIKTAKDNQNVVNGLSDADVDKQLVSHNWLHNDKR